MIQGRFCKKFRRAAAVSAAAIMLLVACMPVGAGLAQGAEAEFSAPVEITHEQQGKIASLQVPFIKNEGQVENDDVKFYADTFAGTVFVTAEGITYALAGGEGGWVIKEEFAGAKALHPEGRKATQTAVNIFKGRESSAWKSGVSSYEEVALGEIYDRIDVKLRAYGNNVEKIFTVYPGGDPAAICLNVAGAEALQVNGAGELELLTGLGAFKMTCPVAYQEIRGKRLEVAVAYDLKVDGYGFKVGAYDPAYPLVIDPLLGSTFLGGSGNDTGKAIIVDAAGNIYAAGSTTSTDFPTTPGAYDGDFNAVEGSDIFVAKLSSDLTGLLAATYLGGSYGDYLQNGRTLALDSYGNLYLAGYTKSTDFPIVNGYDSTFNDTNNNNDAFVVKLSDDLSQLLASTFLGGAHDDRIEGLILDAAGNVFVAGYTRSTNFPIAGGFQQTHGGGTNDGFVARLSGDLSQLLDSTYIGSNTSDDIRTITLDAGGDVWIAGRTGSNSNYPTTEGAWSTSGRGILSRLSADLSELKGSTFTDNSAEISSIITNASGDVYVTFNTTKQFPTTPGAYQTTYNGHQEIVIAKFNSNLTELLAATHLGGSKADIARYISLDSEGNICFVGTTLSTEYPTTPGAYSDTIQGGSGNDIVITKIKGDLSGPLIASTLIGGTGNDTVSDMYLDPAGNVYLIGNPHADGYDDFPLTEGAYQTVRYGTSTEAFIVKMSSDLSLGGVEDTAAPWWVDGSLTVTNMVYNELTLNWSGATDDTGVIGYRIYRDGSEIGTVEGSTSAYNVTGLTAETGYTFKVEAGDAAGNWSTDGPQVTVTTPADTGDTVAPTWPGGSTLTPSNITSTGVTLTWTPAADDVGVTEYRLFKDAAAIATVSGTVYSHDVSGLAASTSYTFKVEAGDAAGNWSTDGPSAEVVTASPADIVPPIWPGGSSITVSPVSATSIHLSWPAAVDNVGVAGYKVHMQEEEIATVYAPDTGYTVTGLPANSPRTYDIYAFDAAGNTSGALTTFAAAGGFYLVSAYQTTINGSPPVSSDGLEIEGSGSVPVNAVFKILYSNNCTDDGIWPGNKDKVSLRDGSGNNVPAHVFRIPNTLNFDERNNFFVRPLAPLQPSAPYKLVVAEGFTARNGNATGLAREVSFTTEAAASDAPSWSPESALTASNIAGTGLTLSWPAAEDTAGVSGYVIFQDGEALAGVDGSTTSFDVTGLSGGTSYDFQVQAFNAAGNWSVDGPSTSATTILDTSPPAWPAGSSLEISAVNATGLLLTWSEAGDDVAVTNYRVYQGDILIATVGAAPTTYTVTGLDPDTAYTFRVEAGDAAGNWSTGGPVASADTLPDTGVPVWPPGSTLTAYNVLDTALSLTWTEAADDVAVTGYQIFKDGTLYTTVSGSTTACNVVGLDPDTTYTFRVEAGDAAGNWSTDGPAATATTAAAGDLTGVYIVTPVEDAAYTTGATADGIRTMTVKSGITGNRTFSITVNPVVEHTGDEKAVFVLLRNGLQIGLQSVAKDFDTDHSAGETFNVEPGDVVKVYIVDDLYTLTDFVSTLLQQ